MIDINLPESVDLQAFLACVEHGSFSAAARAMSVPRQTVTRRIQRLENTLGVQLLRRSQQEFQTTETGLMVYGRVKVALAGLQAFVDDVHANSVTLQGRLRITTMPLDWGPLRRMFYDFRAAYPAVKLEVLSTTRCVDLVHENFDVAIRGGTSIPADTVARPLGQIKHLVMASPDYLVKHGTPHSIDDLGGHRFVSCLFDDGSLEHQWPKLDGTKFTFVPDFCLSDIVMRRDAVIQGHGLAILPDLAVEKAIHSGELKPILTDTIGARATFALLYLPSRLMRPVVRTFNEFAIDWVKSHTDWLGDTRGRMLQPPA